MAGGGQDSQRLRCKAADALYGVPHPAGFCPQLRLIGDMPQAAPTAALIAGAVRLNTVGGGRQYFLNNAVAVAFLHLNNPYLKHITGCGHRYKYCNAVSVSDPVAFVGNTLYRQGDNIVLF